MSKSNLDFWNSLGVCLLSVLLLKVVSEVKKNDVFILFACFFFLLFCEFLFLKQTVKEMKHCSFSIVFEVIPQQTSPFAESLIKICLVSIWLFFFVF
jgi:hypothetical protein